MVNHRSAEYKYKVKLFVPKRKKPITRQLHTCEQKYQSISVIKEHILTELKDEFPDYPSVDIGYFEVGLGRRCKIQIRRFCSKTFEYFECSHGHAHYFFFLNFNFSQNLHTLKLNLIITELK